MSDNDRRKELLTAIDAGQELDWAQEADGTDDLKRLHSLFQAFRAKADPVIQPVLFHWRHLDVVEFLDKGSFGEVFRARDSVLRRDVALKLARDDVQSISKQSAIAEARRMARLRHPNILAIHGADEADGKVGIWSDLLRGITLDTLLERRGSLPPDELMEIAEPLADALVLVHRRDLIHGDIKPANIMLEPDGSPVLMDFGAGSDSSSPTAAIGSPLTMAPELFEGQSGSATDMYSLGVVMFVALTGSYPHNANDLEALADRHQNSVPIDFDRVPRGWRALLQRLLVTKPEGRATAQETKRALERIRTAGVRRRRIAAISAVIAGLALAAGTGWYAYGEAEKSRTRTELVKDAVLMSLESALPVKQSGPVSVATVYHTLSERIEETLPAYPKALAEMRLLVGFGLTELGQHEDGLAKAEQGADLLDQLESVAPIERSKLLMMLGAARETAGDLIGAQAAVQQSVDVLDDFDIQDDEAAKGRFTGRNRLSVIAGTLGDWSGELAAQQALLADRAAYYGEEHMAVAVDHHNVSMALSRVGLFADAVRHSQQSIGILLAHGDQGSVRLGYAKLGLAYALLNDTQWREAQAVIEEVVDIYRANLPADHPSFISVEILRARADLLEGQHDKAIERLTVVADSAEIPADRRRNGLSALAWAQLETENWVEAAARCEQWLQGANAGGQPTRPLFEAALAWANYQLDPDQMAPPPLRETYSQLVDQGYGQMPMALLLKRWVDQAER